MCVAASKVCHRYEFSRGLWPDLISLLRFLQFFLFILPLFLLTSSSSSYLLSFSHEIWRSCSWNTDIIFLLCVTSQSRRQMSTFHNIYLLLDFYFFPSLFHFHILCVIFIFNRFRSQYYGTTKNWYESLFLDSSARSNWGVSGCDLVLPLSISSIFSFP